MDLSIILESLEWINAAAGGVWIVLSGILIFTLFKTKRLPLHKRDTHSLGIVLLISIFSYPIYTGLIGGVGIALLGNMFTLWLTFIFSQSLGKTFGKLRLLMYPQIIWLHVASVYVFLQAIAG